MQHDVIDGAEPIIEWAPFRLKPGVDEPTLLAHSTRLQDEFLAKQPGFVRRELLKGRDGEWVDLVWWTDQASAEAVMPAVAHSTACQNYFGLMVGADVADPAGGVSHFRVKRSYP